MKTERAERKKTFNEMLNKSKSVMADELLFMVSHKFFDNMSKEDIMRWDNTCMDFVYNDLGYKKEQVLSQASMALGAMGTVYFSNGQTSK